MFEEQITESIEAGAPNITYSGNEGPKSPQDEQRMKMAQLEEAYEQYVYEMIEMGNEPMSIEQFLQQVMAEGQMSKGPILPSDEDPINPFQPKPQGPVLPDRQMAAYGGIMGMDGRKKYGIGSWFQENIMDPIKENPLVAAAAAAYGVDTLGIPLPGGSSIGGNKVINTAISDLYNKPLVQDVLYGKETTDKNKNTTRGGGIIDSLTKNLIPIAGGAMAGLFTKKTEGENTNPGVPDDNTALQLANLKKSANVLNQKQAMAADMNFTPAVSARKYSPAEMIETYATAANGGRIGFNMGGGADYMPSNQAMNSLMSNKEMVTALIEQMQNQGLPQELIIQKITEMNQEQPMMAMGGRINRAEGGIMDLGGMEKDYRAEGGFVPIGREEKADDVPARLSVNEFVFTADAVRNAGGGDIDQGAEVMERVMKNLEQGGQISEETQGMSGAQEMFNVSERLSEVV